MDKELDILIEFHNVARDRHNVGAQGRQLSANHRSCRVGVDVILPDDHL